MPEGGWLQKPYLTAKTQLAAIGPLITFQLPSACRQALP